MAEKTYPNIDKKDLQAFRDTYGTSAYIYRFLHCVFSSDGFESSSRRAKHESQHQQRFRYAHSTCVHFARGFISRNLLNKHNENYHSVIVEGPSLAESLAPAPAIFQSGMVPDYIPLEMFDPDNESPYWSASASSIGYDNMPLGGFKDTRRYGELRFSDRMY
jgi:hypothetical protein